MESCVNVAASVHSTAQSNAQYVMKKYTEIADKPGDVVGSDVIVDQIGGIELDSSQACATMQ